MAEKVTVPVRGQPLSPEQAMRLAKTEAFKGAAHVSPNPLVGCVVLDASGGFLSSGYHEKYGEPHAEVNAIRKLSESDLVGAQVFVTLEPCAHEGKTPSCAKMLAALPLARVVYGLQDPNPLVSGQGAAHLRDLGIRCDLYKDLYGDSLESELEEVCEAFLWNFRHKKVFVSLKAATSLDGRIALADGTSKWITGPDSREKGHELRAAHDAILIGSGTLVHDDPSLDVRLPNAQKRNRVVVLDTEASHLNEKWKLFSTHSRDEVLWMVAEDRVREFPKARVLPALRGEKGLDPRSVMETLWKEGIRSTLIEGGGRISGAFLSAGLVNRLHLFQAPVILGGEGRSWTEGFSVHVMEDRPTLLNPKWASIGLDLYLTGLLQRP